MEQQQILQLLDSNSGIDLTSVSKQNSSSQLDGDWKEAGLDCGSRDRCVPVSRCGASEINTKEADSWVSDTRSQGSRDRVLEGGRPAAPPEPQLNKRWLTDAPPAERSAAPEEEEEQTSGTDPGVSLRLLWLVGFNQNPEVSSVTGVKRKMKPGKYAELLCGDARGAVTVTAPWSSVRI
ncbi:unnamed protein product [Pleuronectes platessa]|uniref:Uncharacterized protein n=1 Tax=Pleuronectes platessa TaxID=8262 RepID=A0A9N7VLH2_PLEPL|nr:unnamed protein product [Pleuronectes platessa]